MTFDGNELIEINGSGMFETRDAFTIGGWFRTDVFQPFSGCPWQKRFGAAGENSWQLCIDESAAPHFYSTTPASELTGTPVSLMEWHYMTLSWSALSGQKQMTVDGVPSGVPTTTPDIMFDSASVLIGADIDGAVLVSGLIGAIDDVRIYDRVLSSDEILALATRPLESD
ncbi:MAG TPA: LamG domain-containing protein [Kofleriaceae bacterium]|jgi:hypothetical protein